MDSLHRSHKSIHRGCHIQSGGVGKAIDFAWHQRFKGWMLLSECILYIDGDAIVIDKPAGLPVDAPRNGGPSVETRIGELKMGFQRNPVAMHRLDTDTTGCLLFAL